MLDDCDYSETKAANALPIVSLISQFLPCKCDRVFDISTSSNLTRARMVASRDIPAYTTILIEKPTFITEEESIAGKKSEVFGDQNSSFIGKVDKDVEKHGVSFKNWVNLTF